jgi:hypothetical protein
MCHHSAGFLLRQVITEGHKCKHGGWCTGAPPNYVVPNVTFAEPYAQYPQPQQSMTIIVGYVARNMQNVAAIQSNAAQLGDGNANIPMGLAPSPSDTGSIRWRGCPNLLRARVQLPRPPISTTGGGLGRRRNLVFFSFPFFCNFQLVFSCVCVIFSVFI